MSKCFHVQASVGRSMNILYNRISLVLGILAPAGEAMLVRFFSINRKKKG